MIETIAEKNARLRALREARDGTPEEQSKIKYAAEAHRKMARNVKNIRRLVLKLEHSIGERLPDHIRSKIP